MFVGYVNLQVQDEVRGITFPLIVFYPTETVSAPLSFGPYTLNVSSEAPLMTGQFPLVLLSHGSGSTPLAYRTIAEYLVKHGCIVAMPEHFGNNRKENFLAETTENLELRPRHLQLSLDLILSNPRFQHSVLPEKVSVIGHSTGGSAALVLAGGQAWAGVNQKIQATSDERVAAVVLMAPATSWFVPEESLKPISAPILVFAGGHDKITPRWQMQLLLDYLPSRQIQMQMIENAGHYSFLSPFPEAMRSPQFAPSVDPEGFDREGFNEKMNKQIIEFIKEKLNF